MGRARPAEAPGSVSTARGVENTIPWQVLENLAYFKAATTITRSSRANAPGSRCRFLPERTSIVLTSISELIGPAAEVAYDLDEALAIAAKAEGKEKVWVFGGG